LCLVAGSRYYPASGWARRDLGIRTIRTGDRDHRERAVRHAPLARYRHGRASVGRDRSAAGRGRRWRRRRWRRRGRGWRANGTMRGSGSHDRGAWRSAGSQPGGRSRPHDHGKEREDAQGNRQSEPADLGCDSRVTVHLREALVSSRASPSAARQPREWDPRARAVEVGTDLVPPPPGGGRRLIVDGSGSPVARRGPGGRRGDARVRASRRWA
jgi:hypothetical protein